MKIAVRVFAAAGVSVGILGASTAACVGDAPGTAEPAPPQDSGDVDAGIGAADSGPGVDAAKPRCDVTQGFAAPTLVPNVNSLAYETGITLTEDENTMYLGSNRDGSFKIYRSTRGSAAEAFSEPKPVDELNQGDTRAPTISPNGLTIFLRSNRTGTAGQNDIWVAKRQSSAGKFGTVENVGDLNGTLDDIDPAVRADGLEIFFSSIRNDTVHHIWSAPITAVGAIGAEPMRVEATVSTTFEGSPVISADGLDLYFRSDRTAGTGSDIWMVHRETPTSPFGSAVSVDALNSGKIDAPGWLSKDGCLMYLISDRNVTDGEPDFWVATRPPPP